MFEKLFNKPKENSKVEQQKDTTLGVSSMKIIAKNTLIIPRLAKELKVINKSFRQLVRLEGGQPAESESLKSYNNKYGSMKELHIADRKVKRMKEEQRPADFLVVLFEKFTAVLKLVFLGTLFSGVLLAEKILEWVDLKGMYNKITSFFSEISEGILNFFTGIDWVGEFKNKIGDLIEFISFGMFTKKDAMLIVEGAGNFTSEILHRFGEILVVAAKIVKEHFEKLGRFLAIDLLGVDYEEMDRQKKERSAAVEMSESLKKDSDALDVEVKSLQDKRNMLNEKKYKREKDAREQKVKQQEEEAKKKETVGDKLKKLFTPKEAVVEEKPVNISTGASGFGLTAPSVTPTSTPTSTAPAPAPAPVKPETKPEPTSNNLESLVKKEKPEVILKFEPAFQNVLLKLAKDFKGAMSEPIQVNSGFRTGDYQKDLWFNLKGKNAGYIERVKKAGGFDNLTGSKQDEILALMRKAVAAPSKKSGVVIEIDKYGEQPGQVVGKKMIPPTAGKGHEAGLAADISTADLENKTFLKKVGFGNTDEYLKSIGLWRSLLNTSAHETWHIESIGNVSHTDTVENQLDKSSREVATEQRQQEKRKNPVVVNAGTTNNTVIKNQNNVVAAA